jgi:DNA-binding PadR family transcriptional regulator
MHPYEMQRLLKERHKHEVLALRSGSLYHAIRRLTASGLIEAAKTDREGRRPERTTYRITPAGEAALVRWLQEAVAVPRREPSDLMAALNFLVYLSPDDAARALERRASLLEAEIARLQTAVETLLPRLTRINVVEIEYDVAIKRAELQFVRALIADVQEGRVTWNLQQILSAIRAMRAGTPHLVGPGHSA